MNNQSSQIDDTLAPLISRITQLEKLNKRNMMTAWLLGAALLLIVSLGAASKQMAVQDVVRSKSFQLTDEDGQKRALLAFDPGGSPALELYDEDGQWRAGLSLAPDGSPGLEFMDEDGQPRASLGFTTDGSPTLEFMDEDGQLRAGLGLFPDGNPSLVFYDEDGNLLFSAP